jgi:hypothetical protein
MRRRDVGRVTDMGVILSATPVPLQIKMQEEPAAKHWKTTQHNGNVSERSELA